MHGGGNLRSCMAEAGSPRPKGGGRYLGGAQKDKPHVRSIPSLRKPGGQHPMLACTTTAPRVDDGAPSVDKATPSVD
jgi:hypothetical protein